MEGRREEVEGGLVVCRVDVGKRGRKGIWALWLSSKMEC